MPITALAYLLILIAAAYSYHGAPSQRRLPTRYAWDIAWRAAASGFLLLASQHGGYAIPITLAAYMAFLSIQPLLPQLLARHQSPRTHRRDKTRWLACLKLAALIWAPYLRHSPATQYSDAHGYYTYLLTISWLAILGGTYLLRNGKSAWRVLLCANLVAALHYALTA